MEEHITSTFSVSNKTKQQTWKNQAGNIAELPVSFLIGLLFNHEDGRNMLLRIFG
jgi:hypothetical protein